MCISVTYLLIVMESGAALNGPSIITLKVFKASPKCLQLVGSDGKQSNLDFSPCSGPRPQRDISARWQCRVNEYNYSHPDMQEGTFCKNLFLLYKNVVGEEPQLKLALVSYRCDCVSVYFLCFSIELIYCFDL